MEVEVIIDELEQEEMKTPRYVARYLGGGFVPGIPARDLTAEEVERFGLEAIESSGRYEITEVSDGK